MKVATILLALIPAIMATTIPADAQEAEAHRAARELMAEKGKIDSILFHNRASCTIWSLLHSL